MSRVRIFFLSVFIFSVACSGEKTRKSSSNESQSLKESATNSPGGIAYFKYCLACHQIDGSGVSRTYPPLKESEVVNGDKERLVRILLNGLSGEIVIKGKTFNGVMPAQSFLSDQEIADILTYVRSNFGNSADTLTKEEVSEIREKNK